MYLYVPVKTVLGILNKSKFLLQSSKSALNMIQFVRNHQRRLGAEDLDGASQGLPAGLHGEDGQLVRGRGHAGLQRGQPGGQLGQDSSLIRGCTRLQIQRIRCLVGGFFFRLVLFPFNATTSLKTRNI